jgi:hypothetical protein
MMINVKSEETNRTKYVPIGLIVAFVLMVEVYIQYPHTMAVSKLENYSINGGVTNVH